MEDVIEVDNQYYVRAQSSLTDDRTRVLLNGDTFAVFDRFGDDTIVYPGHGDDTTLGAERPHLEEWRERRW